MKNWLKRMEMRCQVACARAADSLELPVADDDANDMVHATGSSVWPHEIPNGNDATEETYANADLSYLQVRIHGIDGSTETFIQNDPDLANSTLARLNPVSLFTEDKITVADEHSESTYFPPLVARIDLVTDRFSVWDFPFFLGAPVELTELEFMQCLQNLKPLQTADPQSDVSVFLDLQMVSGQRIFLWMEVVGGLQAGRLHRIYSLLKERRLIFGLRTGGIGVLNLANLVHFSVHPEPPDTDGVSALALQELSAQTRKASESRHHRDVVPARVRYG
ncbi:MAG: hypothetical protein ABSE16_11600 [Verrucomicrobiota bacterium]|jgi:hypothetical protein